MALGTMAEHLRWQNEIAAYVYCFPRKHFTYWRPNDTRSFPMWDFSKDNKKLLIPSRAAADDIFHAQTIEDNKKLPSHEC